MPWGTLFSLIWQTQPYLNAVVMKEMMNWVKFSSNFNTHTLVCVEHSKHIPLQFGILLSNKHEYNSCKHCTVPIKAYH